MITTIPSRNLGKTGLIVTGVHCVTYLIKCLSHPWDAPRMIDTTIVQLQKTLLSMMHLI